MRPVDLVGRLMQIAAVHGPPALDENQSVCAERPHQAGVSDFLGIVAVNDQLTRASLTSSYRLSCRTWSTSLPFTQKRSPVKIHP